MAKKQPHTNSRDMEGKETVEVFKDLDRSALDTEKFLEKNARLLTIIFGAVVIAVLGFFAYKQFYVEPRNEEATLSYLAAQKNLAEGKEDLALGKGTANPGYLGTFNDYSETEVGKLSAYNAGLIKFKEGKYQEAYDLLDQFDTDSDVLTALKYGAMADCQSNLNKNDDALSLIDQAIGASDDPYTVYYFTRKAGTMSLALNKKAEAKKYFSTIGEKYEDYDNGMSDAYIEMVKYF